MGTSEEPATTVTTVDPAIARRLRAIATKLNELDEERARLVIQAREEGATLREIAEHAGMTHVGISKLLGRHLHPIARNDMDIELDGIEMAQAKHHEKAEGAPD